MSILDVTEDQIFHTLGKGKDPNFKPIEKVRPVVAQPKKPPVLMQPRKTYTPAPTVKTARPVQPLQPLQQIAVEPAKQVLSPEVDESMKKLAAELNELNNRVSGIQSMVKWYIVPQFIVVLAIIFVLFMKT